MKKYIANVYIQKCKNIERKNFQIQSESNSKDVLRSLILEKIDLESHKYQFVEDRFEFFLEESVIKYLSKLKKIKKQD
jgi:hypothetical protein